MADLSCVHISQQQDTDGSWFCTHCKQMTILSGVPMNAPTGFSRDEWRNQGGYAVAEEEPKTRNIFEQNAKDAFGMVPADRPPPVTMESVEEYIQQKLQEGAEEIRKQVFLHMSGRRCGGKGVCYVCDNPELEKP